MFDYNWYIGKQLKQIDRYAPTHLEDCLVLHCDEFCGQYHILRIGVVIDCNPQYLDLITNCYGTFIRVGGMAMNLKDSFNVSYSVCQALNAENCLKK